MLIPVAHFHKEVFGTFGTPFLLKIRQVCGGFCGPDCSMPATPNVLSDYLTHVSMPRPPPTGRIISGGDEEDPDHAGNSGERIWKGTSAHRNQAVVSFKRRFLEHIFPSSFRVKPQRHFHQRCHVCVTYLSVLFLCVPSLSLRSWWWAGISTSLKTNMRSTWRTLNHSQVLTAVSAAQMVTRQWWALATLPIKRETTKKKKQFRKDGQFHRSGVM